MAAVLETKDAAAKNGSQVDEQIAQATSRIRAHDLMFGGLVLVALVLVYTTAMILLDKYLVLPEWVRQVSLLGFVTALAGTAYLTIVSPLRKKINPLYAAKQVENTIDDAKNSVTGYVDAQQKGTLNATVKAALASRAAKSVAEADVNRAVDHRVLLYLGGVAIALFLTLVVLFFVFRPAQFGSLMGRAFVPFTATPIVSRTQIELVKPNPAEPTITTGQTITVAVHISGKVPNSDGPQRVRLMVRHNPADPNFTEFPMVQGETSRDFELRVPDSHVQNGFWYKVAAGDSETPEYKVTVRSLPLFTGFKATYEYPRYLRRKSETAADPMIRAYRGTTVTLVAFTNRDVRDGVMTVEPGGVRTNGTLVAGMPDSLQFVWKLAESGKYKLTFTAADGERSAEPFQSTITVDADREPTIRIDNPEDEETQLPANGQLSVNGNVGDDFGIDTITLKMRITGATERPLPDQPFLYGKSKSFRREKDGTWPNDVDYKGSVDFAALKKDAAGLPLELQADTVIEYWLEATDNCTEPKPNVGKSAVKRVRLTPPKVAPEEKENLDKQKQDRKNEEQKDNQQQQQRLDQEKREQPKGGQQPPEGKQGDKKENPGEGDPKKDNAEPKAGEPKKNGEPKKDNPMGGTGGMGTPDMGNPAPKGMNDKADTQPMGKNDMPPPPMGPMDPNGMGMNQPNTAPMPKTQEDKDVQRKADELKKEIDKENQDGGAGKSNATPDAQDRANPAQPKPQPPMGGMGGMAESKPEPKTDPMANPMKKDDASPSAGKPEGTVEKPADPSAPKPNDPKQADPKMGEKGAAPSEKREEPLGSSPASEKPQPKEAQPQPKDKNAKQDPNSGATAKPAAEPDADQPPGAQNPEEKKDPAGDAGSRAKPMPEQNRGGDKPNEPKAKPPTDGKPEAKPEAGDAKPEKAPPAAAQKPMPKDDMMMPGSGMGMPEAKPEGNANDPKPNGTGAAEPKPAKPDEKKPMAGGEGIEKGEEKPQPKDGEKPKGGGGDAPKEKKLSEQELKELEDAAKNLTSPDENKKKDAREKLDKAVGEQKRKEIEKVANDLQSPDEKTREEAKRKLEEMKKEAQKNAGKGGDGDKKDAAKLDEKQMKEIADAVKDLQSTDEQKKQAAQQKLDKMVGEDKRKEAEQLMKDLQSPDKDKQAAAQKKLDDMKKELEKQAKKDADKKGGDEGKGKEPSKEEVADLAKKAQDLNSKDDKTREQAEKDLEQKLGKENLDKLKEEMKNQKPGNPEQEQKLKEKMEQMAKEQAKKPHDPKGDGLGTGAKTKEAMDEDAKNRLKTAELQLEQFEKKRYDEAFKKKQGFTDAEYDKFLKDYENHVKKMRDEVNKGVASDKPPAPGPKEPGAPITAGAGGKVEGRNGTSSGVGGNTTVEAPGFEGARDKFNKLLNEKK